MKEKLVLVKQQKSSEPSRRMLGVYVETHEKLLALSAETNMSMAVLAAVLLDYALENLTVVDQRLSNE